MKQLLLISLITLQGCTSLKSVAYWYEHSENMMMPEHINPEQSTTRSDNELGAEI